MAAGRQVAEDQLLIAKSLTATQVWAIRAARAPSNYLWASGEHERRKPASCSLQDEGRRGRGGIT